MATVTLFVAGGMPIQLLGAGATSWPQIIDRSATGFTIDFYTFSFKQTYSGTGFTYGGLTPLTGGVISATTVYAGSEARYTISGLSVQASSISDFMAQDPFDGDKVRSILLAGNDAVNGTSGDDVISGYGGNDVVTGGPGNDRVIGDYGNDELIGGGGDDTLDGVYAWNSLVDTGTDLMRGGSGNDTYLVNSEDDVIVENAGEGFDAVTARYSYALPDHVENLFLYPVFAAIRGTGNAQDNLIVGNTENNVLDGGGGNDTLVGTGGDDSFLGREGADACDGGTGVDTAYFINPSGSGVRIVDLMGATFETRDAAGDTFTGIERLWSLDTDVNDSFRGTAGADVLVTGGGDDDLVGRQGADVLDGGDGFDTVWYESIGGTGLVVDWLLPAASTGEAHNDILVAIERVFGAGMNDEFRGGNGNEVLAGGGGDDILDGRLGDDILDGGAGNDIFIGGLGRDVCIGQGGNDRYIITSGAESTEASPDIIVGFETGQDKLDLTLARTGGSDSYAFVATSEGSYLNVDLGGNGSIDLMVDVRGIIVAADLLW